MPQQLLETGFTDCGSVRVSYSATATPTNAPPLDDAAGRYFLVDRAEPTQALKIVLNHALATDPYDLFAARCEGTITTESYVDGQILTNIRPSTPNAVSQGHYKRYEDVSHSDSTSESVTREVYNEQLITTYDDDWNPIETVQERFAFELPISSVTVRPGQPTLTDTSSFSGHRIETIDGRKIDWETGAVSDGWSIVVYEVYEWGDSELTRFRFDTDPQTVTAECLGDQLCDNGCIEFVIDEDGAYNCICPDDDPALGLEPPIDPDIALEIPPREQLHRNRPKLKKAKATLAKSEQEYRETLGKIGQKEQELKDAVSQGNSDSEAVIKTEIESLLETGGVQAGKYQDLKNDYANDSQILNDLTEPEKESEITVVPAAEGWRYPTFTQGTKYPTINKGSTVSPTIIGTTIQPTINRGITVEPVINRFKTTAISGVQIGGALPTSDSTGIQL